MDAVTIIVDFILHEATYLLKICCVLVPPSFLACITNNKQQEVMKNICPTVIAFITNYVSCEYMSLVLHAYITNRQIVSKVAPYFGYQLYSPRQTIAKCLPFEPTI